MHADRISPNRIRFFFQILQTFPLHFFSFSFSFFSEESKSSGGRSIIVASRLSSSCSTTCPRQNWTILKYTTLSLFERERETRTGAKGSTIRATSNDACELSAHVRAWINDINTSTYISLRRRRRLRDESFVNKPLDSAARRNRFFESTQFRRIFGNRFRSANTVLPTEKNRENCRGGGGGGGFHDEFHDGQTFYIGYILSPSSLLSPSFLPSSLFPCER